MSIAIRRKAEVFMLDKISNYVGQLTWQVKRNIIIGNVAESGKHLLEFIYV